MDLTLYKPTEQELWLNKRYQDAGIYYAADLDIDRVADIFSIEVALYGGKAVADWVDGSHCVILLNAYMSMPQRREVFFHELSHPIRHVGRQESMPTAFMELQEIQAAQFQVYAAIPIYMLEEFNDVSPALLVKVIAEEFILPEPLVRRRLEQIAKRIYFDQIARAVESYSQNKPVIDLDHVRRVMARMGQKRKERVGAL